MNNKGFTLIELLVVVLIIGILAAMALPQYFKAVERSRMSEAVTLMANIAQSQQRKYLQINKYVSAFNGLDVAPKGASGRTHCTKITGNAQSTYASNSCGGGNGFVLQLTANDTDVQQAYVQAKRASGKSSGQQYDYELARFFAGTGVACHGINKDGADLCADFCGVEELNQGSWCCNDGTTNQTWAAATGIANSTCAKPSNA